MLHINTLNLERKKKLFKQRTSCLHAETCKFAEGTTSYIGKLEDSFGSAFEMTKNIFRKMF